MLRSRFSSLTSIIPRRIRNTTSRHTFHSSGTVFASRPYLLADIGEGITECQITQWFVKPGDIVQEFDPICEVQSDKASVEITSRFDGKIEKLLYEVDAFAKVGKPLVYIQTDEKDTDDAAVSESNEKQERQSTGKETHRETEEVLSAINENGSSSRSTSNSELATPAVRHMIKQHNLQNTDIQGTGKDGRVMKEDVQRHVSGIERSAAPRPPVSVEPLTNIQEKSEDQIIALSPIQHSMFQAMSRSLNIPHFLYSHSVDVTLLNSLRKKLMSSEIAPTFLPGFGFDNSQTSLTTLPFIVKALSHAFHEYPLLNSHLDVDTDPSKPKLIMKASHNFGIAVDTPQGLLVPVLRNVQDRSIIAIAAELQRLSAAARNGQLSPNDFGGATFTISNMGSIGGGVLNPVIVPPMVAILGIGRAETTPAFEKDHLGKERIVKKERTVLSWAGDHRVLDGATMAKCARMVETILHNIDCIVASLK